MPRYAVKVRVTYDTIVQIEAPGPDEACDRAEGLVALALADKLDVGPFVLNAQDSAAQNADEVAP